MKNMFFYGLIFVASVIACSTVEQDFKDDVLISKGQQEVVITATMESQPETRTVLGDDYLSVLWKPEDEIKVFSAGEASKFTSQNTENEKAVNFKGMISVITGTAEGTSIDTHIYGLYPYTEDATMTGGSFTTELPSVQTGLHDSFDDDLFISIGRSYTFSMGFWNVCSGYRFSFTEDGYQSVTLSSNDGTPLAGMFVVTFDENGRPVITSHPAPSSSVTVNAPDGGFVANTWYYIVVLPGTHEEGYTFTATNASGTGTYVVTDPNKKTFNRSRFRQIAGLDEYLEFPPIEYDYVEMCDGLRWATMNVGATSETDYGDYFAWAETTPRYYGLDPLVWKEGLDAGYDFATYKYYDKSTPTLTDYETDYFSKYQVDDGYFSTIWYDVLQNFIGDGVTTLEAIDDAATQNWGDSWRTPTDAEWTFLRNRDFFTWTWDSVHKGYTVTSKISGYENNSIFLPAAGGYYGVDLRNNGVQGEYWSSSLSKYTSSAMYQCFTRNNVCSDYSDNRVRGKSIRPVSGSATVTGVMLNKSVITLAVGASETLVATVLPLYAFNRSVSWVSSDESIATVDSRGKVTLIAGGTATITVTTIEGGYTATCNVMGATHAYVEMGDGLKWATMNVGANSETEYGDYFAWGETEAKAVYNWQGYKHMTQGQSSWIYINKYQIQDNNTDAIWYNNGVFIGDNLTILEREDDAASANWGGTWRTPTEAEWAKLNNTQNYLWSWTDNYNGTGVAGYTVTSKVYGFAGNCIFLPAAGYYSASGLTKDGIRGYYWTSSLLDSDSTGYSWYIYFTSSTVPLRSNTVNRSNGLTIRPVSD